MMKQWQCKNYCILRYNALHYNNAMSYTILYHILYPFFHFKGLLTNRRRNWRRLVCFVIFLFHFLHTHFLS